MRLSKKSVAFVLLGVLVFVLAMPAIAFAQEGAASTANSGNQWAFAFRSLSAALAIAISALAAGYAQANIGAAGAGTLAERPETATYIIVLTALPEIVALLGFVLAFLINSAAM
jgi:V/A-type H+-transporting ATPase subunit K